MPEPVELQEVLVYRCGTCGHGFDGETPLRAHQDKFRADPTRPLVGQPDEHDGEPWIIETVRVGDHYVWEPESSHARSHLVIEKIIDNGDSIDRYWIVVHGDNPPGSFTNDLSRFAEAVWPGRNIKWEDP